MIYRNYILGKKLSGLDIYSIFLFAFIITVGRFLLLLLLVVIFFFKLWRLVNANCHFCVFILYYFYFNLVGINQKYMQPTITLVDFEQIISVEVYSIFPG